LRSIRYIVSGEGSGQMFENIATSLKMLGHFSCKSVLTGKPHKIYSALSVEQSCRYDAAKTAGI